MADDARGTSTLVARWTAQPDSIPLEVPAPRHATEVPPGLLRRRLLEGIGHGHLLEIARVRGSAQDVRLIDREEKTVCVVSVERGAAVNAEGERRLRLDERVRVVPVKGYAGLATRIAAHLSEEPGWQASGEALFDEAIRRMGRGETTELGTRIAELLRSMERHRKAIDPAGDPEELHDFRVCLRRIRTLFAQTEPSDASPPIAAELKWLGAVSGKARDFDVQAQDLRRTLREECARFRAVHPQIEKVIEERRVDSHLELRSALASRRYVRLLRRAQREARNATPRRSAGGGGDAATRTPSGAAALYRKALRQGRELGPHAPDEKFHRLRKTIKKLRYLLEARPAAEQRLAGQRRNPLTEGHADHSGGPQRLERAKGAARSTEGGARRRSRELGRRIVVHRRPVGVGRGAPSGPQISFRQALRRIASGSHPPQSPRLRRGSSRTTLITIAAFSIKGGVGKSTAVANLAYLAARAGKATLLCDLDPPGSGQLLLSRSPEGQGRSGRTARR